MASIVRLVMHADHTSPFFRISNHVYYPHLDGSVQNMLDPEFCKAVFSDEVIIVVVSTHLCALWTVGPAHPFLSEKPNSKAIAGKYALTADHNGYGGDETEPNTAAISVVWREVTADIWDRVHVNVMRWIPEANCSVGHSHFPCHELLAVIFPGISSTGLDFEGQFCLNKR